MTRVQSGTQEASVITTPDSRPIQRSAHHFAPSHHLLTWYALMYVCMYVRITISLRCNHRDDAFCSTSRGIARKTPVKGWLSALRLFASPCMILSRQLRASRGSLKSRNFSLYFAGDDRHLLESSFFVAYNATKSSLCPNRNFCSCKFWFWARERFQR